MSGVVGRPSRMSLSGGRPFWMSRSGREALPDIQAWLGGPPKCMGVVGWPSRRSGIPSQMYLSGGRTFQMSGSGWEAFPDVQKLSGVPPKSPGYPPG